MSEHIVNLSDTKQLVLMLDHLRQLSGPHRITIVKHRSRRSDRQNRYYWPCFVQVFGDFLRSQGDTYTDDDVHGMFKHKFLKKTAIDKSTGEVLGDYTRSTTDLTTSDFNEYLDNIAAWLGGFGIRLPEPGEYHEANQEQLAAV